jgi:cell wall-associated NlpC family hydrolase
MPRVLVRALVAIAAAPLLVTAAPPDLTGTASAATAERASRVQSALQIAQNQKGDRYRYGAAGPHRFDCSGLVYFSTHKAGFGAVPRTSSAQSRFMRRISRANLRAGDFVFFTGGSGVYHVGIYVGRRDGRRMLLHAPGSGKRVRVDPIWTDRWFAGTLRGR